MRLIERQKAIKNYWIDLRYEWSWAEISNLNEQTIFELILWNLPISKSAERWFLYNT